MRLMYVHECLTLYPSTESQFFVSKTVTPNGPPPLTAQSWYRDSVAL